MHRQFQISPGVYVTDFRENCQLKGIDSQVRVEAKDVGLILDKLQANESKIKQLLFSNDALKQEQNWETDQVLLEAIEENYELMIKFSGEIKEWILDLVSLKYKAESDKIENLIDPERISVRQNEIQNYFNEFENSYGKYIEKHNKGTTNPNVEVQVSSESQNESEMKPEKPHTNLKQEKSEDKKQNIAKKNQPEDQGVYL